MAASQSFLLSLTRMALWGGQEPLPENKPDWKEIIALAKAQTLMGLIADAVPMLPTELQPDPQSRIVLHSTALRIINSHSLLNRKVVDMKSRMDSYGINTVLLKGQGIALLYPNPQCRQCGDIDLYVGEKNFARTLEILAPDSEKKAKDYKYLKHFDIEEDGVSIEIHRIAEILPGSRHNKLFQKWTIENLEGPDICKVKIGGVTVNTPPVCFNAIYIMNHAWHHFMEGGIGLRQLCDWAMYLHRFHKEIDIELLRTDLARFGLTRAWKILSAVVVGHLGLPAEECPLYDSAYTEKGSKVISIIWSEGNFGHHSSSRKGGRPKGFIAGKLYSLKINTSRIAKTFIISPIDVMSAWVSYVVKGIRNL